MPSVSPDTKELAPVRPVFDSLTQRHVIEKDKRLSESCLWTLQSQYYGEQGFDAFQQVPCYGTGNAVIGRAFAELILGALLDMKDKLVPGEPIYILELGGGSGRLAQYILKHLNNSQAQFPMLKDIRYVLSDAMESMLDFWVSQPVFEPFIASGKLDFAVFDPLTQPSLTTHLHQYELKKETLKNPVMVVATYFFDTIAHDSFYIDNHQLNEVLVSLTRDAKKYSLNTPVRVSQLQLQERNKPTQLPYYNHPVLDDMLSSYCEELTQSPLVIPTQGLRVLDNLREMTETEIVFITSDKGYGNPANETSTKAMGVTFHGDAFSMCVNFDAVQRYVSHHHGYSTFSTMPGLKTFVSVFPKSGESASKEAFPMMTYWFEHNVNNQDVINQAINTHHLFDADYATNFNARFDVFSGLVCLNQYDPRVFSQAYELIRKMDAYTHEQVAMMRHILQRVEDNIVGNTAREDVFFELVTLHQMLGNHEQAQRTYDHAVRLVGVQYNLAIMMGAMYQQLNQPDEALTLYQQAYEVMMQDDSPEVKAMAMQIQHVIQQLQSVSVS